MSSQPCGCDPEANDHTCDWHKGFQGLAQKVSIGPGDAEVEVRVRDPKTGGEKGQKSCQIGALDPRAVIEVGKVAGFGARKYARYNFAKGYAWSLSFDAVQRHLLAWWDGEDRDPESGLSHLAHAAWHCLTLMTFAFRKRGTDDRFPQEVK